MLPATPKKLNRPALQALSNTALAPLPVLTARPKRPALSTPPPAQRNIQSGLDPYNGIWGKAQAKHLLKRLTFGAPQANIDFLLTLNSAAEAVELLLSPIAEAPAPPINNYDSLVKDENDQPLYDATVPLGETWVNAPYGEAIESGRFLSFKSWWIELMLKQNLNATEKITLFLHNHFGTQASEVFDARLTYRHNALMRQYAFGNFKELVKKVTNDPLMLIYLNNAFNIATQPDENYARELQELFCIGKDNENSYTEEDVQAAARVLTGFTLDYDTITPVFINFLHDYEPKQFSSFYNNTVINGNGESELDDLLSMLFNTPDAALYICRKIYRFFVYHEVSTEAEVAVIQPLAQIFRDNNYELKPVFTALFSSQHFFDTLNIAAIIKSPIDFVLGFATEFNVQLPTTPDFSLNEQLTFYAGIYFEMANFLQDLADPPNVAGYPAYYQFPQYDKYWITTGTYPKRAQMVDYLMYTSYQLDEEEGASFDFVAFTKNIPNAEDPNALIDFLIDYMYSLTPTNNNVKNELKNILLAGQQNDYYWTYAWTYYLNNPNEQDAYNTVFYQLFKIYQYILHLEEYQLM